jgi:hypothetical protein
MWTIAPGGRFEGEAKGVVYFLSLIIGLQLYSGIVFSIRIRKLTAEHFRVYLSGQSVSTTAMP